MSLTPVGLSIEDATKVYIEEHAGAAFVVLLSVGSKEEIFIVLQRKSQCQPVQR